MILKNPTTTPVYIVYLGEAKSILAGGTIEVSEDYGKFWKNTHGFLEVLEAVEASKEQKTIPMTTEEIKAPVIPLTPIIKKEVKPKK